MTPRCPYYLSLPLLLPFPDLLQALCQRSARACFPRGMPDLTTVRARITSLQGSPRAWRSHCTPLSTDRRSTPLQDNDLGEASLSRISFFLALLKLGRRAMACRVYRLVASVEVMFFRFPELVECGRPAVVVDVISPSIDLYSVGSTESSLGKDL